MTKTIIQVPIDKELLQALDKVSNELSKSRAELIRHACRRYLQETEEERLDRIYQDGYKRIPESAEIGESQLKILKHVWPKENW
jgi:metal-responsive CopG/Arc/MetJ family transcriptional regulator